MKSFTLNERADTRPNDRYWQFCVGSCHAALALRADYQRQLKRAHDELGFQRVRFHGIFVTICRLSPLSTIIYLCRAVKK